MDHNWLNLSICLRWITIDLSVGMAEMDRNRLNFKDFDSPATDLPREYAKNWADLKWISAAGLSLRTGPVVVRDAQEPGSRRQGSAPPSSEGPGVIPGVDLDRDGREALPEQWRSKVLTRLRPRKGGWDLVASSPFSLIFSERESTSWPMSSIDYINLFAFGNFA